MNSLSESLSSSSGGLGEHASEAFGLGSKGVDGITFVRWSFWFNMPLTLFFMAREWPKYFGWWKKAPKVHLQGVSFVSRAIGGAAGKMATAAGSVLPSSQLGSALGAELTTGTEHASR